MSDSFSARRQLFQSALFQDQVADRLELDRGLVYPAINAMLQADMIPCRLSRNHKALATDGAMILAAIGGRQSLAASIVRVGCAVCAMNMQHEIGAPQRGSGADMFPTSASFSFGTDVAEVLLNLWRISRGSSTKGFKGVTIGIYWSDVLGSTLFGAIEQPSLVARGPTPLRPFPPLPVAETGSSFRCRLWEVHSIRRCRSCGSVLCWIPRSKKRLRRYEGKSNGTD